MMRNLRVAVRNLPALVFTVFQPVLWMALFSQNFKQLADVASFRELGYTSYLAFFVPSILVLTVLNASTVSGISMVTDMNAGVLDKFLISPISRSSILAGRLLADAIAMVVQCLVVLAIAFAMGANVEAGFGGVMAVLGLTILLGMCTATFSNFIALRTRNAQLTMIIGGISTLPLLLLSPAFFPEQLQAGWLRGVEKVNPVAYVVRSGQDLMNVGPRWGQLLSTLGVLALTGLLCFMGTIRAFRRATGGSGGPAGGGLMARLHGQAGPDIPESAETPAREKQTLPT
jgi:ABC-2 type transport system permease protein